MVEDQSTILLMMKNVQEGGQINVRTASDVIIILYQKYDCNNLLFTPVGVFTNYGNLLRGLNYRGNLERGFNYKGNSVEGF